MMQQLKILHTIIRLTTEEKSYSKSYSLVVFKKYLVLCKLGGYLKSRKVWIHEMTQKQIILNDLNKKS